MFSSTDRLETRLLTLAGIFLGLYSLALTLSSAVLLRSWNVQYRWSHWLGFLTWLGLIYLAHRQLSRQLPDRDPFLFPIAALLSGWGLLTIWRLSSLQALRQTAWLVLIGMVLILVLRYDSWPGGSRILSYLRRFKYIWLTSGLLLTAGTLFLGANPLGSGPRLWLGCCGVYFQPSEPLKLLLIIYLAAYLADRQVSTTSAQRLLPLLTPTLLMTGLALLLLIFQRDLGTAALFIMLYAVIVYAGTGNRNVLIASVAVLLIAGIAGYALFDVVSQRVDAWLNPWLDPSGRSYQVVQSLLAVANGGVFGRGPGMGSPGMVPIAQSDFIFSAITEESGLLGAIAILSLLILLVSRGFRVATKTRDTFQRLLAIGLVSHLVGQSILIIAGNLRLLPLTGVTLPFVSNGGSSLLVSFFELLCLLLISARQEDAPVIEVQKISTQARANLLLSGGLVVGITGAALVAGWWSVVRGSELLSRTDNPRRSIADSYVQRGAIVDRSGRSLAESSGHGGDIVRLYPYPSLGPLVGYTDPAYGQAGLEASLDPYLRGTRGYPTITMSWEQLLYGQPPPGLDVRLSLDLDLQARADQLMQGSQGALVLLNADTGEVLAMSSSPSFDANTLAENWENLVNDPHAPLLNRATMGMYPPGNILGVFLMSGWPNAFSGTFGSIDLANCAITPASSSLAASVAAGCDEPVKQLAASREPSQLINFLDDLGMFTAPRFPVETLSSSKPGPVTDAYGFLSGLATSATGSSLKVSPLQLALAAASISNGGNFLDPRLAMAVENPQGGWVMLPVNGQVRQAIQAADAEHTAFLLAAKELPIWQAVANAKEVAQAQDGDLEKTGFSWYIGGTLPDWKGARLAVAILLEQDTPQKALEIGQTVFQSALYP